MLTFLTKVFTKPKHRSQELPSKPEREDQRIHWCYASNKPLCNVSVKQMSYYTMIEPSLVDCEDCREVMRLTGLK